MPEASPRSRVATTDGGDGEGVERAALSGSPAQLRRGARLLIAGARSAEELYETGSSADPYVHAAPGPTLNTIRPGVKISQ